MSDECDECVVNLEQILSSDELIQKYIKEHLPPRLSFMSDEKRFENVKRNLQFKLRRLKGRQK